MNLVYMEIINIHQAKTQLSKLLTRVALGEELIIANRGVPVAKLSPYHRPATNFRIPGRLAGKIKISQDFDQVDDEIIRLFEGEEE
jgi:prevent-host-death family protein